MEGLDWGFEALDEKGRPLRPTFSTVDGRKKAVVQTFDIQELRVLYDIVLDLFVLDQAYMGYLCGTFGVAMASWVFLVPNVPVERIEARFVLPDGWNPVTPWQRDGTLYWTSSMDFFVSSVFTVGKFEEYSRVVRGTNVTVAVFAEWPQAIKWALAEYSFTAYEAVARIFAKRVQNDYLSIYVPMADDGANPCGVCEWTQAQACAIDPHGDAVFQGMQGILHRAFHNWNNWPPYGMSQKSEEESWFREGVNRYYDDDKIPIELAVLRRHLVMRSRYDDYLSLIAGTKYDVPVGGRQGTTMRDLYITRDF